MDCYLCRDDLTKGPTTSRTVAVVNGVVDPLCIICDSCDMCKLQYAKSGEPVIYALFRHPDGQMLCALCTSRELHAAPHTLTTVQL